MGLCLLCRQQAELIQSHIVPEGFYKPVYDGKHRAIRVDKNTLDTEYIQKGLREYLLCADCDNTLLGPWDGYASRFWSSPTGMPDQMAGESIVLNGIDYERFKLFHLSVLWRAAACSWSQQGKIDLGPHFDAIRDIILRRTTPDETTYPFWGMALVDDRAGFEVCKEILFYAGHDHRWGIHTYILVFGGVAWHYAVSSHIDDRIPHETFTRKGELFLARHSIHEYRPLLERLPAVFAAASHGK